MVQLQLPPFSQFEPALLLVLTLVGAAAWGWSLFLLATAPADVKRLPVWLWAVLLVFVPFVAAPMFLLVGAPISSRARRAVAISAVTSVIVTTVVVAIQQIGILDCRTAPDGLTGVCEMAPRSTMVPVAAGILTAIAVGGFVVLRRPPRGLGVGPAVSA